MAGIFVAGVAVYIAGGISLGISGAEYTLGICVKNDTTLDIVKCKFTDHTGHTAWKCDINKVWQDETIAAGAHKAVAIKTWYFAKYATFLLTLTYIDNSTDAIKIDANGAFYKRIEWFKTNEYYNPHCFSFEANEHIMKVHGAKTTILIETSHTQQQLIQIQEEEEDRKLRLELEELIKLLRRKDLSKRQLLYLIGEFEAAEVAAHDKGFKLEIQAYVNIAYNKLVIVLIEEADEVEETDHLRAMKLLHEAEQNQRMALGVFKSYENRQKLEDVRRLIKTAEEYNKLAVAQEKILQMEDNVEKANQMSKLIIKLDDVIKQCEKKSHMSNRKVFEGRLKYLTKERDDLKKTLDMLITSNQLKVVASLEKNITASEEAVHQKEEEAQDQAEAKSVYQQHVQQMTVEEKQLEEDLADLKFDVVEETVKGIDFEWNNIYPEDSVIDQQF